MHSRVRYRKDARDAVVKGRGAAAPGILEGSNGAAPAYDSTPTKGATGAMASARLGRSAAAAGILEGSDGAAPAHDSQPLDRSSRKRKPVDRYQPEEWVQRAQKCRRLQHWHPATVVGERGCGGSREYCVRWDGYSSSDDSWLPPTWITKAALEEYLAGPPSTKRAAVGGAGAATGRGRAPSNAAGKRKSQQRGASPETGASSDAASVAVANANRDERRRKRQATLHPGGVVRPLAFAGAEAPPKRSRELAGVKGRQQAAGEVEARPTRVYQSDGLGEWRQPFDRALQTCVQIEHSPCT